ncbi:MAG: hypothetical protein WC877_01840 [Dehalococcoidales bacterium]|jgi:hypothetical protein
MSSRYDSGIEFTPEEEEAWKKEVDRRYKDVPRYPITGEKVMMMHDLRDKLKFLGRYDEWENFDDTRH